MRKRATRTGLSLVELMIAFLILLVVALYIMSLFASGQKHWLRAQQYSIASFLVHGKMQEAMLIPLKELPTGRRRFDPPYEDFTYQVDFASYEGGSVLYTLDVEVFSRIGTSARASTLVGDDQQFAGVVTDPYTNLQTYSNGSLLTTFDGSSNNNSGIAPDGRRFGGIAGVPGSNLLWSASGPNGLMKFLEAGPPVGWVGPVGFDVGAIARGLTTPSYNGISSDSFGNYQLAADSLNRCVWLTSDPAGVVEPLRPSTMPLGQPSGIATDPYASLVWVCDQENQCLRKLLLQAGPTGYVPGELDGPPASGTQAYWVNRQYKPAANLMLGNPQGIAMDKFGWAVYVVDRSRLYRYIDSDNTWTVMGKFDQAQIDQGISGLAMDSYNNLLYLNTLEGKLYEITIPSVTAPGSNATLTVRAR